MLIGQHTPIDTLGEMNMCDEDGKPHISVLFGKQHHPTKPEKGYGTDPSDTFNVFNIFRNFEIDTPNLRAFTSGTFKFRAINVEEPFDTVVITDGYFNEIFDL